MKKIIKISLVLVGLVSTLNASARNSHLVLNSKKVEGTKVSFTLNEMEKAKLSIYDSNDDLIFKEDLTGIKKLRMHDLSALPEGQYILVAENELKFSKYKLDVYGKVAKLNPVAISEVVKPVFIYQPGNKMLSINIEKTETTPISITVYDSNRDVLYSKITASNEFINAFNLKDVKGYECTFVVSYSGNTFEKNISL